jgi:hypothetical protein
MMVNEAFVGVVEELGGHIVGIDCTTKHKHRIIKALEHLQTTLSSVQDEGVYHTDPQYSCIQVHTLMREADVEHWLWKRGFDYMGVFTPDPVVVSHAK